MNFLELYEETFKDTEPPKNFHLWTAISVVSTLMGRKVYLPFGHYEVFPNLYVCLVGKAGSRKSTANDIGCDLLRMHNKIKMGSDSTSREAIIETIEESKQYYELGGKRLFYHQAAYFNDELQEFIGQKHVDKAIISFLITVFRKKKYEYRTKNSGSSFLSLPCMNLLSCATDDWITKKIKNDMISDGLGRRIIFVYEKKREKYIPWPEVSKEKELGLKVLQGHFQKFYEAKGVVRFTREARELWEPWYIELQESIDSKHPKMQSYYGTKHDLVQKLCMILSVCFRDDLVVDTRIFRIADEILTQTEKGSEELIAGIGRNELSEYHRSISDFVMNHGTVSITELVKKFAADLRHAEYSEVMQILCDKKEVELVGDVYKSLRKIASSNKTNLFDLVKGYEPAEGETPVGSTEVDFRRLQL